MCWRNMIVLEQTFQDDSSRGNKHLPCNNELNMLLSFVGDSKHTFRRGQLFLMVLQWGFITTMLWFLFCFECM